MCNSKSKRNGVVWRMARVVLLLLLFLRIASHLIEDAQDNKMRCKTRANPPAQIVFRLVLIDLSFFHLLILPPAHLPLCSL